LDVVVVLEYRFDRTPDGAVWTQTGCSYPFWQRYLTVFGGVRVVARVRDVERVAGKSDRVDGPGVAVAAVPYYIGPRQYLAVAKKVRQAIRSVVGDNDDAVLLRVPSQLATVVMPHVRRRGRPYGVEVLGDPFDVFAPGAVRHPLRPFFRWWFTRQLRRQCAGACAALYVTRQTLQRRYPCPGYSVGVSDVELPEAAFVAAPRAPRPDPRRRRIVTVGSLAQLYKGPDVLIDAVAACVRGGMDVEVVFIGDGKHRPELEQRAAERSIADRTTFLGQLQAGEAVRAELDRSDLFVLPSRTEGLPRAMIEAMARGLPCIGSSVGGIPELLPPEALVAPGDADDLARKITSVLADPDKMAEMSAANLALARTYRDEVLSGLRTGLYDHLRRTTEQWVKQARPARPSEQAAAPALPAAAPLDVRARGE
jgi:glycosyltransferase involved in cell wall biosynthesis